MIKKNSHLLILLIVTFVLFNIQIHRINPFEFDTNVFLTLLESLIRTGKAMIPIVSGSFPSICDLNLNCNFVHPVINGQQLFTQLPTDYTSGIALLFIPYLINNILTFFYDVKVSLIYLIQIYSAGACLLYFISAILIIKYSKINLAQQFIYIAISFISQILINQNAANGIVGELYASTLISNVALGVAMTLKEEKLRSFNLICAVLLGIAVESKISIIFPAFAIFSVILLKNYYEKENKLNTLTLIFFICLAKITAVIYYYFIFDFNFNNLVKYFNSIRGVYTYNAGAGMSMGNTNITKQLSMILVNDKVNPILYIGAICSAISFILAFTIRKKNILMSLTFVAYILASSLIFPIIFKFPYTRILSAFFGLYPLVFFPIFQYLIEVQKKSFIRIGIVNILLTSMVFTAYQISPPRYSLFKQPQTQNFEPFIKSYPSFNAKVTDIFLTSHFFSMPWDVYLSGILDNQGPLNKNTLYGNQTIQENISNITDLYVLQSCRWGHCAKENQIEVTMQSYQGQIKSLRCSLIPRDEKAIYKLFKCSI
jgi:hypothetical protein